MEQPKHSKLGASGAERWMKCPGSVALLKELCLPESEDEDWRVDGTTAHAGAAFCLEQGIDAWEAVGKGFDGEEFTPAMASSVQVYLDACRSDYTATSEAQVEKRLCAPDIHPLMFGTTDHYVIDGEWLILTDYKNGAGVVVEVENNPQERYYAFEVLVVDPNAANVKHVKLRIVQPNAFHPDGPVREEVVSAEEILAWGREVLVPAMLRTDMDDTLDPGQWCRFCPAKLVCPMIKGLFAAMINADPKQIIDLSDGALSREYRGVKSAKFYQQALEKEIFRRLNLGRTMPDAKLVRMRANRVWKPGAADRFKAEFGQKAYTAPELKTPPQMEAVDPLAPDLVREWAYTPQSGLTVALADDKRVAVRVQTTAEVFNIDGEGNVRSTNECEEAQTDA